MQYGHPLKALGKPGDAEQAYHEALALEQGNADTFLQLDHVLKIKDRVNGSLRAVAGSYRRPRWLTKSWQVWSAKNARLH